MQKLTRKDQLLPHQSSGWLLLDSPSEESECSAPTFSPISSGESQSSSRISGHIGSDTKSEDEMNQNPQKFLPSPEDVECLNKEMAILLSR